MVWWKFLVPFKNTIFNKNKATFKLVCMPQEYSFGDHVVNAETLFAYQKKQTKNLIKLGSFKLDKYYR